MGLILVTVKAAVDVICDDNTPLRNIEGDGKNCTEALKKALMNAVNYCRIQGHGGVKLKRDSWCNDPRLRVCGIVCPFCGMICKLPKRHAVNGGNHKCLNNHEWAGN